MPKIVNHDHQKQKVAEAAWRVILKQGMEQASVRNIADEAGLSVGSLRHYFATQSDLYAYSMNMVSERVAQRIQNIKFSGDVLHDGPLLVHEILPLDQETRLEMEVWFAFVVKSLSDLSLESLRKEVDRHMRVIFTSIVQGLIDQSLAKPDLNADFEAERFYALVDGLAMHAILRPELLPPDKIKALIRHHLYSLCISEVRGPDPS
ncbi:TetR/AcrR family transcriptional regulator [Paenibacillus lemnae]|uniref:TetR family transcriptional regulator n=1 Tax=Paenibacillus lemnae TaxID=1330551 RepID=A0A848MCB5_PAELE|nr:TetR/AcrR family transcriptional regulator [Paenibacillus lemnae]NMO97780.1 TetR family transcriptional regulator [Paenibacillus lemnae]